MLRALRLTVARTSDAALLPRANRSSDTLATVGDAMSSTTARLRGPAGSARRGSTTDHTLLGAGRWWPVCLLVASTPLPSRDIDRKHALREADFTGRLGSVPDR